MERKQWVPELDDVLREVGDSGKSRCVRAARAVRLCGGRLAHLLSRGRRFDWESLKQVCAEYYSAQKDLNEPYEDLLQRLLSLLQEFPHAPFTVQRLCELLLDPHRIYTTSTRKMSSAVEKLLTVSSTVPLMQVAVPKPGTYQAASETDLKTLVGGEAGEPMEVEQ